MAAGSLSLSKFRSLGEVVAVAGAVFGRNSSTASQGQKNMTVQAFRISVLPCKWRCSNLNPYRSQANIELGKELKIGSVYARAGAASVSSPVHSLHISNFFQRQFYATSSINSGRKTLEKKTSRMIGNEGVKRKSTRSQDSQRFSRGKLQQKEIPVTRLNSGDSSLKHRGVSKKLSQSQSTRSTKLSSARPVFKQFEKKSSLSQQGRRESFDLKDNMGASTVQKQKKGKRIMRLDPKDMTSKRLQYGYPLPGEEVLKEESKEDESGLSKNAQFRAIQPSPKLLLHIDRHMLGRRRLSEWQKAGYDAKLTPAPLDNSPYTKKDEREPIQEEVFRHKLRFAAAAKLSSSFPPVDLPEVAFAGRSNVGKSSLINALTRQWGVARTSDKPGLTQSINFFRLGGRICLVDLPGYGFAYAKEEKIDAWEELVKEYVSTRDGLRRVCLLVDAKWGLKPRDEELIVLMESAGTRYQIVLTKTDTIFPIDLARRVTQIQEVLKNNKSLVLPLMMVSSKTGGGLGLLRESVAKIAKPSLI